MIIERPAPVHKFLDAKNLTLLSVNAAMMVADFASTKRALQVPGAREANPLMQSPGAAISLKIVGVGAGLGFAYLMHRAGHHQAERLMPLFVGVPSTAAAWHNAGIHR
jgi:glucokinase